MIEGSIKAERLNKGGKIKSFTSMIKSWQNDPLFRSLHNQPNNIVFFPYACYLRYKQSKLQILFDLLWTGGKINRHLANERLPLLTNRHYHYRNFTGNVSYPFFVQKVRNMYR